MPKKVRKKQAVTRKTTEADKEAFLIALEAKAGHISQTCKAVGIARRTFYNWIDQDSIFSHKYVEVREGLVDFAEATLLTLIKEKHPAATIFFLRTQARHRGYTE